MNKDYMMNIVYNQLSIDYNCNPHDFLSNEFLFTVAEKVEGRRALPFIEPRLEIVTFGKGLVINSSSNIINYVKKQFLDKSKLEIMNSSLIKSFNPYYLPDLNTIMSITSNYDINGYEFKIIQKNEIKYFYKYKYLHNALQYDMNSERPEILGVIAYKNNQLIGIACASEDSSTMWQIGVDVLPEFRGNGIAVKLVNLLACECLKMDIVPYYTTDIGNINSQKVAIKSGFFPAWSHCFRTRLNNHYMTKFLLSKI